ncbi:unnamed protein product, partial [Ectocarpus sp. 12 AP-2014]
ERAHASTSFVRRGDILPRRSQRITGGPQGGSTVSAMACVREAPHHHQNMKAMGHAYSLVVYRAAVMPTKGLFEEAIEPVKKDFPANYKLLMKND